MKISVAIITANPDREQLSDCLHSIVSQRVIKADEIRIYDSCDDNSVFGIAESYSARVIKLLPNENPRGNKIQIKDPVKYFRTEVVKKIVNETDDDNILILLSDDCRIDPSAISELFRYFLKYQDLALIYGRQIADPDCNHLTRYVHNIFFPITRRDLPLWHLMKIYCSFNFVAYRVKFIKEEGVMPSEESSEDMFDNIYMSGKLSDKGYRTMYNPLAICHRNRELNVFYVYQYTRGLFRFLKANDWLTEKWWIRKTDLESFFINFKDYIRNYSSIPFSSFYATVCFTAAKIGELLAEIDYQRSLKRKTLNSKDLIATTLFDKENKLYK
jgi:hypothetical protein